jgi:hypothetical protein
MKARLGKIKQETSLHKALFCMGHPFPNLAPDFMSAFFMEKCAYQEKEL